MNADESRVLEAIRRRSTRRRTPQSDIPSSPIKSRPATARGRDNSTRRLEFSASADLSALEALSETLSETLPEVVNATDEQGRKDHESSDANNDHQLETGTNASVAVLARSAMLLRSAIARHTQATDDEDDETSRTPIIAQSRLPPASRLPPPTASSEDGQVTTPQLTSSTPGNQASFPSWYAPAAPILSGEPSQPRRPASRRDTIRV